MIRGRQVTPPGWWSENWHNVLAIAGFIAILAFATEALYAGGYRPPTPEESQTILLLGGG